MKRLLLIILIAVLILSSCYQDFVEFPFDETFEDWSKLEPVIKDFDGDFFADRNITADGLYTGCEKLNVFGDMLHCNDNGSTIWFDRNNCGLYRLNYKGQKEKICPEENCRNNINGECNHMQIYGYIYSDGYLYFTITDFSSDDNSVFVFRYDTDIYEYEKLLEIQNARFGNLALNGRYLYAQTYNIERHISDIIRPDNRVDFTITRIDLFTETAVVVYSDLKNPDDFDKIGELNNWRFIDSRIIMPKIDEEKILDNETKEWIILKTGSSINISTIDMLNFNTLIEMENENILFAFGGDLKLYNGEIYFSTSENGLSRIDSETGKREILNKNINNFCIDQEFLYYTVNGDNNLYRIKLDYSRELSFNNTFAVYIPEQGENFVDWKVSSGYLYMVLNTNESGWSCRVKLNSEIEREPYLFYREY